MSTGIQIDLDPDAALVLFELLASREEEMTKVLHLEAPERNAQWLLEGALERTLVEPFRSDYLELLAASRRSLIDKGGPL